MKKHFAFQLLQSVFVTTLADLIRHFKGGGIKFYLQSIFLTFIFFTPNLELKGQTFNLPVVIHVIYTDSSATNISDSQIDSALIALNNDYRKILGTQGYGNGVDTEIEFCLAQRDPDGNATTGINRIYCDGSCASDYDSIGFNKEVNELAVKSLSIWPTKDYYNIWIVWKFSGSLSGESGYTVGCDGYENISGSVILFNAFGIGASFTVLNSNTDKNRTITHEAGHWLNLLNTYEGDVNGTTCPPSTNCDETGDKCCDTNPHIRSNNTCTSNSTCGSLAPIHNYMDNSTEECKSEFTQDQKERMQNTLGTCRLCNSISLGCWEPCSDITSNFTPGTTYGNVPFNVFFDNESTTTTEIDGYNWYIDCALVGTSEDLSYEFTNYGTYEICLDAYNEGDNCINRHCETIYIGPITSTTCSSGNCDTICEEVLNPDFDDITGTPASPNTPQCVDLSIIDDWEEHSNGEPWYCHYTSNTYLGGLYDGAGFNQTTSSDFIVGENAILLPELTAPDRYELSLEYSLQRNVNSAAVLDPMEVSIGILKLAGFTSASFTHLERLQNVEFNYPSSTGVTGSTNYYCLNPSEMEFSCITKTFNIPSILDNGDPLYLVLGGKSNTGNDNYIFFNKVSINSCPSVCYGDIILDWRIEGCSVDFEASTNGEETECQTYTIDYGDGTQWETGTSFSHEYSWPGIFTVRVFMDCGAQTKVAVYDIILPESEECDDCEEITNLSATAYKCDNEKYISTFNITIPSGYGPCNANGQMVTSQNGNIQVNSFLIDTSTNVMSVSLNITPNNPDYSNPMTAFLTLCDSNGNSICYKLVSAFTGKKCDDCDNLEPVVATCDERNANGNGVYTGSFSFSPPVGYTLCDKSFSEAGFSASYSSGVVNFTVTTSKEYPFSTSGLLVFCQGISKICFNVEIKIPEICPRESRDNRLTTIDNPSLTKNLKETIVISNLNNLTLQIDAKNNELSDTEVAIFDVTGKLALKHKYSGDKISNIDISGLINGVYLISITNKESIIFSDKFVVTK
ncbi:MAG: T9SS type A sorting domain-containing protein [Saprospiraceae bacterium]|nr:T9SS type A sorting domain-containing protein [Saprospiraceae bacterium]